MLSSDHKNYSLEVIIRENEVSDNGPQYSSHEYRNFALYNGNLTTGLHSYHSPKDLLNEEWC